MIEFEKEIAFLKVIGADEMPHSGRTLLEHLIGVTSLLKQLGRDETEQKAGLFHSIYGTEYYKHSKKLKIERQEIIDLIGEESENLVNIFCNTNNRTRTILNSDSSLPLNCRLQWLEYANIKEQNPNSGILSKFEEKLRLKNNQQITNISRLNIAPIFATPISYINFGEQSRKLNERLVDELEIERLNNKNKERTFSGNDASWQSQLGLEKKYEGFKKLQSVIKSAAVEMLDSIYLKKEFLNYVEVESLWGNIIYDIGGWSQPHVHGDGAAFLSGVYYPKSEESENINLDIFDSSKFLISGNVIQESGVLVLRDPAKIIKNLSRARFFSNTMYYGANIYIRPREGILIFFPASLEHFVTPVLEFKEKRYSISFTVNIKK
jgi:hypothetical protein